MKICWDNLEKLDFLSDKGEWCKGTIIYIYMDSCKVCKEPYIVDKYKITDFCSISCSKKGSNHHMYGKKQTEESNKKRSISLKKEKSSFWKGGYNSKNIPFYNTYAHQIEYAENVRRNKEDNNILEVKCAYCGKWHIPKLTDIWSRIRALNIIANRVGEARLYCSDSCKRECPIYNQNKYPKGYKKISSREVQPELRQMVFERDNWICQKCGSTKSLHCHHVEGIRWIPLESADIDKCITYCKKCHIEVHQIEECGYQDMQCGGVS